MSIAQHELENLDLPPTPRKPRRAKRVPATQDMDLARSLVTLGLRPPLVSSVLQIPIRTTRALWWKIHEKSPPGGGLAWRAASRIRNTHAASHAMTFYVLYLRCARRNDIAKHQFSIHAVERAYLLYRSLTASPVLDFTTCFLVARDSVLGLLREQKCSHCQQPFFQHLEYTALRRCPWCTPVNGDNGRNSYVIQDTKLPPVE